MNLPINDLRKNLDSLFSKENDCFEGLEKIKGFELVEKRNPKKDRINGINCFCYVLGQDMNTSIFDFESDYPIITTTKGYHEVDHPEKGDLVVYLDTKLKEQVHIGFSEGKNKVRSKWTYGDVYIHDIDLVPECYGNVVKFFRKNPKIKH